MASGLQGGSGGPSHVCGGPRVGHDPLQQRQLHQRGRADVLQVKRQILCNLFSEAVLER